MAIKKYLSLEGLSTYDALIKSKIEDGDSSTLASAKSYADSAASKVKSELLNGAGQAYDTLKELGDLIDTNQDAIEALETVASGKANAVHTHTIANITNLQSTLDGKAASSHGTHVNYSTTVPVMDGTAAVGTASTVARSDHKHPVDTSRASKTEFDTHASSTIHITSSERTNWNSAYTSVGTLNTTVSSHTTSITSLQSEVSSWESITSSEIQSLFNT